MFARTAAFALFVAGLAAAHAHNETIATTTKIVEEYTTYCPHPTTLTYGEKTYTVTEATTLTITDCPCTITEPVGPYVTPQPLPPAPKPHQNTVPAPPHPNSEKPAPPPAKPTENVIVSGGVETRGQVGLVVAAGIAAAGLLAL